ncbi:unnamed protein product [Staurois parvus]|uniref:Uncharacterized protein n=2 Tax=Staurois parvus TaxID=386267 RepID=A0ABN9DX20_9NEOB|nr:unnamed protein product [Staurois parvus]
MGPCTASSCCCQARNLPWAPVPPPHAAARPVICHGAPVPPPHAAARSRVSHGSLYGLPLLLSPSPHSAMCHFQVSSHCWCVPFCHRVLADYGPPIAAARPVICHGPLYRLLMLLPGPESLMGPCTASHCCCLHRHTLPCATFRSPHTAGVFHFLS